MKINEQLIEFGDISKSSFQSLLNQYSNSKKVIIVDDNTHDCCLEFLITTFTELSDAEVILLPAGEENKVMEVCFQVWEALTEYQIGRKDLVINLGGGVVTDMGGFIAAIFKRGVNFVNIPTSLLGMVDAAVGGKTGIDLGPYKNQLGTFTMPIATYVDTRFLATLPEIEIWNGYAELLKHALIGDPELWNYIKQIKNPEDLHQIELIERAARIKINIVTGDPQEKGSRKLLNLGHTIGHAFEGLFIENENPIPHGHAVAIGVLLEARLSNAKGILSDQNLAEIEKVISIFPPLKFDKEDIASIVYLMENDKKNSEGSIKGILIKSIGECDYDFTYDETVLEKIFSEYIKQA